MPGSEAPSNDSALASGSSSDQGPGGGADSTAGPVDGGSVTAVLDLEGVRRRSFFSATGERWCKLLKDEQAAHSEIFFRNMPQYLYVCSN